MASFAANSSVSCRAAALDQDKIGWQNLVEGKLTIKWRELQEDYYTRLGSQHLASSWASSLVSRLLELVHSMWKQQNAVDHKRDKQGLQLESARESAIHEQFVLGTSGLACHNHHYIRWGKDSVRVCQLATSRLGCKEFNLLGHLAWPFQMTCSGNRSSWRHFWVNCKVSPSWF